MLVRLSRAGSEAFKVCSTTTRVSPGVRTSRAATERFCHIPNLFPLSSDPYAWGDTFPSCHPLLEEHHSPINLDPQMTRNQSLGSLHLEGFDDTQTGHWTLQNDGHSGEHAADPVHDRHRRVSVLVISCVRFAPSRAAGGERHVGERRRSSRCVPHHPAALPLGGAGQQRLGAHGGRTQIPDGGTVGSVDSATPSDQPALRSTFNVSESLFGLFLDAHRQHEGHPPQPDGRPG